MKYFLIPIIITFLILTAIIFSYAGLSESPQFRNVVTNSVTGDILSEQNEWIWLKEKKKGEWKKLIPGVCPQWYPDGNQFFYFLDVGYDGTQAELWAANADGEGRVRLSKSDYFVWVSPVVSKDGKKLAYFYQTCRASGEFKDIVVIELKVVYEEVAEGKVVLRTRKTVDSNSLKWSEKNTLEIIVDGKKTEIDTSVQGKEQLP